MENIMKNESNLKYTYKHRKVVMYLANKYIKENKDVILGRIKNHDLDKMFMYLFYDKRLEIKIDCIIKKVLTKDLFSGNIIKVVSGKRLRQAINEILQKEFQKHVDNNQSVVLI